MDSEWDENARYGALGAFKVPELVVEEDVGAKGLKDAPLVETVHEKEFCRAHAEDLNVVMSRSSLVAPREVTMEIRMAGLK